MVGRVYCGTAGCVVSLVPCVVPTGQLRARMQWFPLVANIHRFAVICEGCGQLRWSGERSARDPVVWYVGVVFKVRKFEAAVGDRAFLTGGWQYWPSQCVTDADVAAWLLSVGGLLKFVWFLTLLHWPFEVVDLGVGCVS